MLEAQDPITKERFTLPGSRWSGTRLTAEQAEAIAPQLICLDSNCQLKIHFKTTTQGAPLFEHNLKPYCWPSTGNIHAAYFESWVWADVLTRQLYEPYKCRAAAVVPAGNGKLTAVRPAALSNGSWEPAYKEHRSDAAKGLNSMWLVHARDVTRDGKIHEGWVTSLLRSCLKATDHTVAVGILEDECVWFIGDLAPVTTLAGFEMLRIATATEKIPVDALRYWAQGMSHQGDEPIPAAFVAGVKILDSVALHRIGLVE
ncbi:hypothetical protein [Paeniglutamicibacter sp.]|uniref:hypothetical protein n=1 Tax=Paeniglutamicibacter sp. TaxID=1934391 RepID=UPI003989C5EB